MHMPEENQPNPTWTTQLNVVSSEHDAPRTATLPSRTCARNRAGERPKVMPAPAALSDFGLALGSSVSNQSAQEGQSQPRV